MANEEHVAVLKQGREAWSKWDENYPSNPEVVFSRADFSGADFRDSDLSGLDLGVVDFDQADLSGSNLFQVYLGGANLSNANLQRVNLTEAELGWAMLVETDLSEAILEKAVLTDTILVRANLRGANLSKAHLQGADLTKADLSQAVFQETEYDDDTIWPEGFLPPPGTIKVDRISKTDNHLLTNSPHEKLPQPHLPFTAKVKKWLASLGSPIFVPGDEVVWLSSNDGRKYIAIVLSAASIQVQIQPILRISNIGSDGSFDTKLLSPGDRIILWVSRQDIDFSEYALNFPTPGFALTIRDSARLFGGAFATLFGVIAGGGFPLIVEAMQSNLVMHLLAGVVFLMLFGLFLTTLGMLRTQIEKRSMLSLKEYGEELRQVLILAGSVAFVVGAIFLPIQLVVYPSQVGQALGWIGLWAIIGGVIGCIMGLLFYSPQLELEMRKEVANK